MPNKFDDLMDYLRAAASGIGGAVQGQFEAYFDDQPKGGVVTGGVPIERPAPPDPMDLAGRFIADEEGFSATPYSDFKQTSIGYGTKAGKGDSSISRGEALARLKSHLASDVAPQLEGLIDPDIWDRLSPNQRAALMSLTYNVGAGSLGKSKALKALNKGDFATFEKEAFDPKVGFVRAGGKVLKGLQERRSHERKLWKGG